MPFNASTGATQKELKFTLANRAINPSLVDPEWKVYVTQLECPNSAKRVALKRQSRTDNGYAFNAAEEEEEETTISGGDREMRGRVTDEIPSADAYWVAPMGCLQYFPESSGTIESFNFANGNGVYMGNMKYSICFRKTSPNQQLRWVVSLSLSVGLLFRWPS